MFLLLSLSLLVKRGVDRVEILRVEIVLRDAQGIAEALIVHDLALAQEFDWVADIGIVAKTQNVVIGRACLLFGGKVFVEVGQKVALDSNIFHIKRHARCGEGINARGMIDKIGGKGALFDFLGGEVSRQLIENGGDHFKVCKLLGTDIGENSRDLVIGAGIALVQIAHRGAKLAVGSARLKKDIINSHIKEQFDAAIGFIKHDLLEYRSQGFVLEFFRSFGVLHNFNNVCDGFCELF